MTPNGTFSATLDGMRADRLIDLVALLRRHERITAADLARRLGVSRRTILRDLDTLSLAGVPVFAEHGRGGGFSILPGYRPESAGLTSGEAQALFLPGGEAAARALGQGAVFRSARRKLEGVLSDETARAVGEVAGWLLVVPEGWGQPEEAPPAVSQLAAAVARREVIDLTYRAVRQDAQVRRVRPLGLVLAGRMWYLVALRDDSGAQRTYRADRVQGVAGTGRSFEPDRTLTAAWEEAREALREREGETVILRTGPAALPVVRFVLSTVGRVVDVCEVGQGELQVAAVAERGLGAMVSLLAGLGERAEIISPPELIEAIVAVSRSNVARYAAVDASS